MAKNTIVELPPEVVKLLERTEEFGDCKLWTGALIHGKAPVITIDDKKVYVKRRVMALLGRNVEHKCVTSDCTNKLCIEPAHLVVTTKGGIARRTAASGALSTPLCGAKVAAALRAKSKLSQAAVQAIRASDKPVIELAAENNISESYVYMIRRGDFRKDYSSPFAGLGARSQIHS